MTIIKAINIKAININPGFRFIKMLDIGYTTIIYFVLAIITAVLLDKLYGPFDEKEEKKKTTLRKALDLIGMIWLNGVIIYLVRNIVPHFPSPFNGLYGYQHSRLKELQDAYVFDFVLIYNQTNLVKRMRMFYNGVKTYLLNTF